MRRGAGAVVANPVLVGAVTLLVTIVAVFLAYNANNGLPFVPTHQLYAEMENGAEVNPGVEVREGGYRIGVVEQMEAKKLRGTNKIGAVLRLRLDQSAGPFPSDSKVLIRPRAPLALKIIEFERGKSTRTLGEGETIPVKQTDISTDLDELYSVFDEETRDGQRNTITGFGTTLAGRGRDLNTTIRELPEFFGLARPVMRNLASPEANLPRFLREIGDFVRITAPVAEEWARSFRNGATTFDAINRDPEALKATIEKAPGTMDASIRSFRVQRPFLRDTAGLSRDLDAVADDLRASLPTINQAIEVGTPVLRRTPKLDDRTQELLREVDNVVDEPTVYGVLRGLAANFDTLGHTVRYLGPYITGCNYWNIFWTFTAEHFSQPDPTGSSQRVLLNTGDRQNDNLTNSQGANEPANGKGMSNPRGIRQYAHYNAYGANAVRDDGQVDCTPGQQGYPYSDRKVDTENGYYKRVAYEHLLGLLPEETAIKGGTYDMFDKNGRGIGQRPPRLPEGQTFTDVPGGDAALTEHDRRILRSRGQERP